MQPIPNITVSNVREGKVERLTTHPVMVRNRYGIPTRTYSRYLYKVTSPYSVVVTINGMQHQIRVPIDFLADGNSSTFFNASPAWVFHDWLYSTHAVGETRIDRATADRIMILIQEAQNRSIEKWLTQSAMKWLSASFEAAWLSSGARGPEYVTTNL